MRDKYAILTVIVTVCVIIGGFLLMRYAEGLSGVTPSERASFWTPGTRGTMSCGSHLKSDPEHLSVKFRVPENVIENDDGVEMYRLRVEVRDENRVWLYRKEDLAPNSHWRGHWIKPGLDVGESWSFAPIFPENYQGRMKVTGRETFSVGDDEYEVFTVESSVFPSKIVSMGGDYKLKIFYSKDIHMILGEHGFLRKNGEGEFKLVRDWHITSLELAGTE